MYYAISKYVHYLTRSVHYTEITDTDGDADDEQ